MTSNNLSRRAVFGVATGAIAALAVLSAKTKTVYAGDFLCAARPTKLDLEMMEQGAHWALERAGCDPASVKFAFSETHDPASGKAHKRGTFYVWEGQAPV